MRTDLLNVLDCGIACSEIQQPRYQATRFRLARGNWVGHELVLEVGPYGDVKRKASVVYGRRVATSYEEQTRAYATLTETEFAYHDEIPASGTTATEAHLWYRASVQYEQRTWELTGISLPSGANLWTVDTFSTAIAGLPEVAYESPALPGTPARRLVERAQQLFSPAPSHTGLTNPLPLGQMDYPLLPYQSYALALTPGIVSELVAESATLSGAALNPTLLVSEGRYESRTDGYWSPGGVVEYDAAQFYLPVRATDPFGNTYSIEYDDYSLLNESTLDPFGNAVVAQNDYRVLAPSIVTDPNLNCSAVGYDALGMVVWTAVMGKAGANEGDTPEHPTTRTEYNLQNWALNSRPAYVRTSAREVHYYPAGSDAVPWQQSYTYSDGFGRVVMQKVQAEPGPVPGVTGDVTDRWVGTGRTVFNNKGNPVKQYEPFFSATSDYEDEASVVEYGVTPIIHYDALDRVIKTQLPNGTLSRVVFDAWRQESWDPNDNVRDPVCTWYSDRGSPNPNGPMPSGAEARAAWLAAKHANTPSVTHLDSLGRAFLVQADNGPDPGDPSSPLLYDTKSKLDIEGNQLAIYDARQIAANRTAPLSTLEQRYDVLGRKYRVKSADAGIRLSVADVAGKPLRSWDSRGQTMRSSYDALQRPTHSYVARGGSESLVGRIIYGESLSANLRLKTYQVFDSAGVVTGVRFDGSSGNFDFNVGFDFKGNPRSRGPSRTRIRLGLRSELLGRRAVQRLCAVRSCQEGRLGCRIR